MAFVIVTQRVKNPGDLRAPGHAELQLPAVFLRLAYDKKRALQQRLQPARNSGVFRGKPYFPVGKHRGMEQGTVRLRARAAGPLHGNTAQLIFRSRRS